MATTALDFVVAMLLDSPLSRIRGTTLRGPPSPHLSNNTRLRKSSSASTSGNVSRLPSTTNFASSALTNALQPLQRADSPSHPPTRSSFPSMMRTSSFASALGSLAGLAMGTQSAENSAPPSPSQSQISDTEPPPAPALNLAQYASPYQQSWSPESSAGPMTPASIRSLSFQSVSSVTNGHAHGPHSAANLTGRFSPATVMTALITRDLIQFSKRRRSQENGSPNGRQYLWEDFDIDMSTLEELEDMGLDVGSGLNQTLPLKSKLYDWCLEYYKEPQMRVSSQTQDCEHSS
jgi:regulatory associated protein of mTOR